MYTPSLEQFKEKCQESNLVPIYREISADLETPVTAYLKLNDGPYSYLLESMEGGEKWGRYCIIGSSPQAVFKSKGKRIEITRNGQSEIIESKKDPLASLKEIIGKYKPAEVEGLPRFCGGAVGYIGYDMVRFFEDLPEETEDDLNIPDSIFMLSYTLVIFDNLTQKIKVVSNIATEGKEPAEAYRQGIADIEAIIEKLNKPLNIPQDKGEGTKKGNKFSSNISEAKFKEGVARCKEYITEGDIFQVVLSQRIETDFTTASFNIYRALRMINPSPYMYCLKLDDIEIIGSSPEVLVRSENGQVELRPIAGTRPRGKNEAEDKALEEELLNDPKERAEHIMLVDLGRNDLGRVSEIGSIEVNELMTIERYSHVMHIVSNIRGKLRPGLDSYDVIKATFPAGTLSGAPKIRAMEIIEEIEPTRRGIYGGAVGYFGFNGNMDMAITIRTLLIKGKRAYLGVGAGIVADSDPDKEYQETINKGKALLQAISLAEEGI
ncbi:MAG: anthranilate synthase component I [Nitrospinae bacterium]|nr:anthranilate synthase component I [Nitrospinota bacterium]